MRRQRIAVVGAGGMARELASALAWINGVEERFEFLGYVVSDLTKLTTRDSRQTLLGDFNWIEQHRPRVDALAIGIGNPPHRLTVASALQKSFPDIDWPPIIHPTAIVDRSSASIAPGAFVGIRCISTVNLILDPFALCNFGTTLGHEAHIGAGSVINPGANVSGGVTVGDEVLIGSGAQILQYLAVGNRAIVGAGAVVTRNVPPNVTVVGVPARPTEPTLAASVTRPSLALS